MVFRSQSRTRDMAFKAAGALLPTRCAISEDMLTTPNTVSGAIWGRINFIAAPFCAHCGVPFHLDHGAGALCAACIAAPPVFDRARAAMVYDEIAHDLVVGFKHGDRTDLTEMLAGWMVRAGADLLNESPLIVPAPLHPRRLAARRFNQSALLAQAIARQTGAPYAPAMLTRIRATPPQKDLSADARQRNVAGAFAAPAKSVKRLDGARVLLIDDVHTTGATLNAAARALKGAGAGAVDALTLARVVKGGVGAI